MEHLCRKVTFSFHLRLFLISLRLPYDETYTTKKPRKLRKHLFCCKIDLSNNQQHATHAKKLLKIYNLALLFIEHNYTKQVKFKNCFTIKSLNRNLKN